jgi:hypothetical protein
MIDVVADAPDGSEMIVGLIEVGSDCEQSQAGWDTLQDRFNACVELIHDEYASRRTKRIELHLSAPPSQTGADLLGQVTVALRAEGIEFATDVAAT